MENNEDRFNKPIGTKEGVKSLPAKPVVIVGKKSKLIYKKGTKEEDKPKSKPIGEVLVLLCKHPDSEEPIEISKIVTIVDKVVKTSATYLDFDEDGNLQKGSMVAILLEKFQVTTVNGLEGKTVPTELDEKNYLAIKAY